MTHAKMLTQYMWILGKFALECLGGWYVRVRIVEIIYIILELFIRLLVNSFRLRFSDGTRNRNQLSENEWSHPNGHLSPYPYRNLYEFDGKVDVKVNFDGIYRNCDLTDIIELNPDLPTDVKFDKNNTEKLDDYDREQHDKLVQSIVAIVNKVKAPIKEDEIRF